MHPHCMRLISVWHSSLPSLFLLFRSFSPLFCSSSFWFYSLHPLMSLCLSCFFYSCFSSSGSYLSHLPYPFLFSLSLLPTSTLVLCFLFKIKNKQTKNQIPPVHLTVQTERSDGVAAGSGARGQAGATAPPSRTGPAPPSRRGCQELPAGRPELFQSRGQRAGCSHRPLSPASPFDVCLAV